MKVLIAVFIGGGLGSMCRYAISRFVMFYFPQAIFPYATLAANVLSCLVLVLTVNQFNHIKSDPYAIYPLLVAGFCGGFSTFSTFTFETYQLIKQDKLWLAGLNMGISMAACLLVFYLLARKWAV